MSGKGVKYEKANMESSDIELPLAVAEAVDGRGDDDEANLVTAIFQKPSKDSALGIIWDVVHNKIVLTGFGKTGLAITQPNELEIGMTLMSINGVSFVSGMAKSEDVFLDEEEGTSSMGLVTEDTVIEASNIMQNAEGTLTIVALKNAKRRSERAPAKRKKKKMTKMAKKSNRNPASSPPPPGAPEGGVWGSTLYYGPTSQLSSVLCCVLGGLIPATMMCCMPFDKRRVYKARNRYYGEYGGLISTGEHSLQFRQEDPLQSTYDSDTASCTCCLAFMVIVFITGVVVVLQAAGDNQQPKSYYN